MSLRVVSLVPSVTESLLAWGVVPVGVTRFCEQPELVAVGGTKDPDIEAIVALEPDLVVLDVEENRRPDAEMLLQRGLDLHVLHISALSDVATQLPVLAQRVGAVFEPELEPATPTRVGSGRRVCVPIWRRPWMVLGPGTYGADLLNHLGFELVGTEAYAQVDELPCVDLVLAPDEPYPFGARHLNELSAAGPVCLVDGKDLFWWGVRTPDALLRLAEQLDVGRLDAP